GNHLHAQGGDVLLPESIYQRLLIKGIKEADVNGAGLEKINFFNGGLLNAQSNVSLLQQSAAIIGDGRTCILIILITVATVVANAGFQLYGRPKAYQFFYNRRGQGSPVFTGLLFLWYCNHCHSRSHKFMSPC